ncbi:MAG: HI0074 family nucleotidyltransferase substrate-binding subunit [Bilifractor sp.]
MEKYENYCNNLKVLERAGEEDLTNEFIVSGIIDKFMIQFELAWKLLKELLKYEGDLVSASGSPRQILKEAYRIFPFINEKIWLEMLNARNETAHIYNKEAALALVEKILGHYIPEFQHLRREVEQLYGDQLKSI